MKGFDYKVVSIRQNIEIFNFNVLKNVDNIKD